MRRTANLMLMALSIGSVGLVADDRDRRRDDNRDWRRDDDYYRNRGRSNRGARGNGRYGEYGQNGPYGRDGQYGRNGQYGQYNDGGLFRSVQQHLRRAASENNGLSSREHDRFNNATRRLDEFYMRYQQGRYDKGKLDQAIEDVNNVVRHNPMSSRSRQVLTQDLSRLRAFRSNGGYYANGRSGSYDPYRRFPGY